MRIVDKDKSPSLQEISAHTSQLSYDQANKKIHKDMENVSNTINNLGLMAIIFTTLHKKIQEYIFFSGLHG